MKQHLLLNFFLLALPITLAGENERTWDFEMPAPEWASLDDGECGIIPEPGAPRNHVYRITTDRPHHTRAVLKGSEETPNFVFSLRLKLANWKGSPPIAYLYGRLGKSGFRGLTTGRRGGRLFAYYGQDRPSAELGSIGAGLSEEGKWTRVSLACYGAHVMGKAWTEEMPEPGWQTLGTAPEQARGTVAFGVWTSPRQASQATIYFDDVRFAELNPEDLKKWKINFEPRPVLDLRSVPKGSAVFETSRRVGLASPSAVLAFERTTGEVSNLVDRASSQEFIAREAKRPLFQLTLTKPFLEKRFTISSRDFRRVRTRKTGPRSLEMDFDQGTSLAVKAHVQARVGTEGAFRLRIQVKNSTEWCVASVIFPQMPGPPVLGDSDENDGLLLPWSSGAILPAPGRKSSHRDALYPGSAFAQFYAFYDGQAGLYAAMEDPEGNCKTFHLRAVAGQFVAMNLGHIFPELPGKDAELPYDIVLRTFQGDWHKAAGLYRSWAEKQPWCVQKLSARQDIPQFLKEGAGILITGIQNQQGREKNFGKRMEKLPDLLDAYRDATGLKHIVFVPYGWENRGTWAGINYFPSIPGDDIWKEVNATLRKRGHRTAFLTSGYWWVIKRQKTSNGAAFDDSADFEQRRSLCVLRPDGTPWFTDNYERTKRSGSWRGLSARLCHGSVQANRTMKEIFLKVAGLGVPLVSFDQEIGGAQRMPCYARDHGHPPGYGRWMWTGFRDLCAEILKEGKPIQPELGLFLENVSELAIPYMATYWSRQFGVVNVGAGGGRGVGLFSYLYHDYVTAIGAACVQGQGARGGRPPAKLRCAALANNLVRGLIPGPFLHELPLDSRDPWRKTVSRAYRSYCRPYAHFPEYLLLGKTVPPPPVSCNETALWFWARNARLGKPLRKGGPPVMKVPLTMPAVKAGSFEAPDGSIATFLVNITEERQETELAIPAGKKATVYSAIREKLSEAAPLQNGQQVGLSLGPCEVRIVLME